jgi:GT2 family glycosyltransferase
LLLLANPDLEMREGAVAALLAAAAQHPDAGAWGGVTLASDGRPDIGNSVHIPSLSEMASRLLGRSSRRLDLADMMSDDQTVEALSGSFMMVPRAVWDRVGGMDERYFLYCEEVDLCLRLSRMGKALWRIGEARAYHDAGHGNAFAPLRLLYKTAGTMQFARIHWSGVRQVAAFILIWLSALQRLVLGNLPGLRNVRLRRMAKGYRRIALAPRDWCFGYHPSKGLLARLGQKRGQAASED